MKNNYDISQPFLTTRSSEDEKPESIFFITKRGTKTRLKQSAVEQLIVHYDFNEEYLNKDTKAICIATAQRAGTWLHKYFFKFYADAHSKLLLHIGPKLSNPFFCKELNTLFFVGHYHFPFSKRIHDSNASKENIHRQRVFKIKGSDSEELHKVCLTEEAYELFNKFGGYFQHLFTALALFEDLNRSGTSTFSQKGYSYYYVYRSPFDHFKSMYLTGQRVGNLEEKYKDQFFKYVVEHFLPQYIFQIQTWLEASKQHPDKIKLIRFEDILADRQTYFRNLLKDFHIPINEEALEIALDLSSKEFLGAFEKRTKISISDMGNEKNIMHITSDEDKKQMTFTESEKEFIKQEFEKNHIPFSMF